MEEPNLLLPAPEAPLPPSPRRIKFPLKVIGSVFGFFILTVGLGFGLLQVQRNQEIQKSSASSQGAWGVCSGNGCGPRAGCYVNHWTCNGTNVSQCAANDSNISPNTGLGSASFSKDCGTEQIDIICSGSSVFWCPNRPAPYTDTFRGYVDINTCNSPGNGIANCPNNGCEVAPTSKTVGYVWKFYDAICGGTPPTVTPTTPPNNTPNPTPPPASTPVPTPPPVINTCPAGLQAQLWVPSDTSHPGFERRNAVIRMGDEVRFKCLPETNPDQCGGFFSSPNTANTNIGPLYDSIFSVVAGTGNMPIAGFYTYTVWGYDVPASCVDRLTVTVQSNTPTPTPTPAPSATPTPTPIQACIVNYTQTTYGTPGIVFTSTNPPVSLIFYSVGTMWQLGQANGIDVGGNTTPGLGTTHAAGQLNVSFPYQSITRTICVNLPAAPTPTPTTVSSPTPTPTPTPMAVCQNVKIYRGTPLVEIAASEIRQGDRVTFRASANATNIVLSTIRFTVKIGTGTPTTYDRTASLVSGIYQADLQLDITQAATYTVSAVPVLP